MIRATLLSLTLATPALADTITRDTDRTVADAMNALEAAVTDAGATIFARIDHAAGAASVDMELPPMELLIFGNPQLGTQAMMDDPEAGLALPLKVLVYEQDGQTRIAYQEVEEMFDDSEIDENAEYLTQIAAALDTLTRKAAE
ncbi:Uncharacterized conserved protein, DUF302 family [Loktanella sp. DSM 29012]|uniref:DUF302 domain-containing protein n=1 Tax=Loktanella sp. DSM 29012 TaxID=1881056 RepID=UPI0008B8F708|nr:DUF302 domain-containing protein [Loktanella sp. DSM 29012]SEP96495.1 Uncharacterized conserved protein, DUF302 family [Loktanella sp. DSM 29012]